MKEIAITQTLQRTLIKATFLQKSPYRHFLNDPNVDRWFRNLMRGSTVTAAERLRRMGWICKHFNTTPQELERMSTRRAEDWLFDMGTSWKIRGHGAATSQTFSRQLKAGSNSSATHSTTGEVLV